TIVGPTNNRQNINANASGIIVSAVYDYDGAVFDGTFTLNNTDFDGDGTVAKWGYTVLSVSGDTNGITMISSNDETYMIWDQLFITIGVDDSTPLNGVQANFTLTVLFDYDDTACTTYQIVIHRNDTWWHSFTTANISSFVDTNTNTTYLYNASLVLSESTYGITVVTNNTLQVVWSLAPNEIPVNNSSPVLANGDETDYLYARYRYYIIITSVSDLDGYADINYVQLSLFPDDFPILYWRIRYTIATDTFSVEFGGSTVTIGTMSNAVGVGDTLTVTWYIKIGWDHLDAMDIDIHQFVTDGFDNDSDFYEANWNIETRLDYSTAPSLSDDRGDVNTSDLIATGLVTYYGSTLSPLSNETDVWILHDQSGTWSGDLVVGSFSISSIGSAATVRMNNYTFKIVAEGVGSGGSDLYHTTSLNVSFITDRIEIYEAGVVDGRIDIDSDCEVWWRARYEYDKTEIQSGLTIQLNGAKILVWDAVNLYWRWQETSIFPDSVDFEVASAIESTFGLTKWYNTTSVQQVIWDSLVITFTDPVDQRINVGTNASGIVVTAVYAFDGTVYDGSFILNNTNFIYASPQLQGYTVLSCSGDTYGITVIGINDETYCIWDRILVVSLDADELYHDPNDDVVISIELQYEYDGTSVLAGSFGIAGHPLTHVGFGFWAAQVTIGTYQAIDFDDFTTCNATLFGINEYSMDSNSVTVYWDRLEFYLVSIEDDRINVGASTEIQWSVRLENAAIAITSGVTAQMTGGITLAPSAGAFVASVNDSVVGSLSFSILSASLGEIGQFIQSASDATVIWDRVLIASITATQLSLDSGGATEIRALLVYEFDSTAVTNGQVNLDDNGASIAMSYNSVSAFWSASVSKSSAGIYTFTVNSVSGNTHGITSLNTDGLSVEVEWVFVPGFAPDPMTLLIVGGVGIGVLVAAIVASQRRKGGVAVDVGDLKALDFVVAETVEGEVAAEPEVVEEPKIEPEETDEIEEPAEVELPPIDEELEAEGVEEILEPEEMDVLVAEDLDVEPEAELEVVEPSVESEIREEALAEPEAELEHPDYVDIPEEFIEPEPSVDLTK
ncbi:MAG: hypothetical protein ACFFCX_17660, partial [Candidatus Sifarchaeia archaeon]